MLTHTDIPKELQNIESLFGNHSIGRNRTGFPYHMVNYLVAHKFPLYFEDTIEKLYDVEYKHFRDFIDDNSNDPDIAYVNSKPVHEVEKTYRLLFAHITKSINIVFNNAYHYGTRGFNNIVPVSCNTILLKFYKDTKNGLKPMMERIYRYTWGKGFERMFNAELNMMEDKKKMIATGSDLSGYRSALQYFSNLDKKKQTEVIEEIKEGLRS